MDKILRKAVKLAIFMYIADALGGGIGADASNYLPNNLDNIKYVQNDSRIEGEKLSELEGN